MTAPYLTLNDPSFFLVVIGANLVLTDSDYRVFLYYIRILFADTKYSVVFI